MQLSTLAISTIVVLDGCPLRYFKGYPVSKCSLRESKQSIKDSATLISEELSRYLSKNVKQHEFDAVLIALFDSSINLETIKQCGLIKQLNKRKRSAVASVLSKLHLHTDLPILFKQQALARGKVEKDIYLNANYLPKNNNLTLQKAS